ncbi:MAG: hypothetical protein ABS46_08875 [Cytophagaceae bacterium SCN 52-12]|nr:MAG: hypothetical protein ABS46_08875 [Cytophagaceae bacterium SCN 52-12]
MRKYYLVVLLLPFIFSSCKKGTSSPAISACGVKDPVNNLSWLKEIIDEAKRDGTASITTIKKFEYEGDTYFTYYQAYQSCMNCIIFDCSGARVIPGAHFAAEEYQELAGESYGPSAVLLWPGMLPRE